MEVGLRVSDRGVSLMDSQTNQYILFAGKVQNRFLHGTEIIHRKINGLVMLRAQ